MHTQTNTHTLNCIVSFWTQTELCSDLSLSRNKQTSFETQRALWYEEMAAKLNRDQAIDASVGRTEWDGKDRSRDLDRLLM